MNIQKMLKQAQKMQAQMQADMARTQEELATKTVESSVGGGKVSVTASGTGEILSIRISRDVVDPEDVEMLEDLVLSGVKQALEQSKELAESEMGKVTAGLNLPPGLGL